ncbi:glycosyltransferase family 4 protein [Salipaludibacillus sp. CUR1]|uniref:glycosyltransferase family 4 protein n=1 Tax=Salipaludibacillus sp. CUR1 TaxID=2820003 RepID=UPI001E37500C|nr:glycosyltransferase family 4 protein [Salipaludibacillus sp. CUR1]MCE7792509.1 glycosyltransferase family 4 protein [Salipaludibacillus sp. CUR1]
MTRKKICFITTTSITIKSFLTGQMAFLKEHGYDITAVCAKDDSLINDLPPTVTYMPLKMKRGIDGPGAVLSIFFLYRFLKKEKFDIVQYSTPNASIYAAIASRLAKVPVRLYCQWGIRYTGFNGWKRKLFKAIEKVTCSLSTCIEPDSYGNLKFSHQEGLYTPSKSRVIWNGSANGVDLSKFDISKKEAWRQEIRMKNNISDNDFVLGFIGRLDKDKGINELFAAYKSISARYPGTKLLLVGPKDNSGGLHARLLERSGKNESVIYSGFTTQVEKYAAAMDVFILPSYREGFGSVVIEAEAMGVPVIVTDIPGPTDAIQENDTGLLIQKGCSRSLVNAIETLIMNPDLCAKMSKNANRFVREHFEQKKLWKYILEDREMLYKENSSSKEDSNGHTQSQSVDHYGGL